MFDKTKDIVGVSIESRWNGLNTFDRLKMILEHPDHFLSLGLVTRDELERVMGASETELEYVIDREDQPLFQNFNLKGNIYAQNLRKQLNAALKAVLL
jgi:hypothetical protein